MASGDPINPLAPDDERYYAPEEFAGLDAWVRLFFKDRENGRWNVLLSEPIYRDDEKLDMGGDGGDLIHGWLMHHCNHPFTFEYRPVGVMITLDEADGVTFRMYFGGEETEPQHTARTGRTRRGRTV